MGALKGLAGGVLLILPAMAGATGSIAWRIDRWSPHIEEASERFGIPEDWIRRVMHAESGGQTILDGRPITSSAGAMGLMQLMPGTWRAMRTTHALGPDPHDPRDNILAGAAYLRAMYDRFGYPGLFAAYNAGPARYAEHLLEGRPLPTETVAYLAAIGPGRRVRRAGEPAAAPVGGLFVSLSGPRPGVEGVQPDAGHAPHALFVPLSSTTMPPR